MPITPAKDKAEIREVILNDEYILSLGFTDEYTYNTNATDEKLEYNNKQIFIYNAPSRTNNLNTKTLEQLIQIDVSVPVNNASIGDLAIEQIIALFDEYEWKDGRHGEMRVIAPSPTPLACQSGFYTVAARFAYYTTIVNDKKRKE